jgi:thymidylate synthase
MSDEQPYLDLVREVLDRGVVRADRTGVGTRSIFGATMRFDLRNQTLPLFTTKRVHFRGVAEELLWMLRGSTDAKELHDVGVKIWDANGTREYLDSIGLSHYPEQQLGPIYGHQWRHFGAEYTGCHSDYSGQGVDQIADVLHKLKHDPTSRRIVLTAWNPSQLRDMALPPCHMLAQFYVHDGELSCQMVQRSADLGLGVPYNVASYSLLCHLLAHATGLRAREFIHVIGDAHVYLNHVEPLQIQLQRTPRPFPKIYIERPRTTDNFCDIRYRDLVLEGYTPHEAISMPMAV